MGIFSLFGKKDQQQDKSAEVDPARARRSTSSGSTSSARAKENKNNATSQASARNVHAARATALKIDAIESEMSSEFVKPVTIAPKTAADIPSTTPPKAEQASPKAELPPLEFAKSPQPELGSPTDLLMNGHSIIDAATPASDTANVIEEVAIMFANNQCDMVEHMLRSAIAEDTLGNARMQAWWMLFDLYRITGNQQGFEELSIDFLNKFETSPPTWTTLGQAERSATQAVSGATPMVAFTGKLDADSIKLIERLQRLSESHRALRLEFLRVTEVDPAGCDLLLGVLRKLRKSGHDLILAGTAELAQKIRSIIEIGRRDDTESAWLLLMEILCLLNRETEFEEVCLDYCVTFEVSPPTFVAPKSKVTTATGEQRTADNAATLAMPAVIEGSNVDLLITSFTTYLDKRDVGVIDCSALARVDFNAAGRLLSGMAPLGSQGKVLEFHHVNHLVAALFNVMGLKNLVRVFPTKY